MKSLILAAGLAWAANTTAFELPQGTVKLSTGMVCGAYNPELADVYKQYGELAFLQGDGQVLTVDPSKAYTGNVRMFLDPKDGSYSVFLDIGQELTCLIVTGDKLTPVIKGDSL